MTITLKELLKGEETDEFECSQCGSLIIVNIAELEESEDIVCSHCGTLFRYDANNFRIDLI